MIWGAVKGGAKQERITNKMMSVHENIIYNSESVANLPPPDAFFDDPNYDEYADENPDDN